MKKSLIPPFFEQESFLQGRFSKSTPPSIPPSISPPSLPRLHPVRAIKALGFQYKEHAHVAFYEVVPLRVA